MIKVLQCDLETQEFQRLSSPNQIADQLDETDPRYVFWLDMVSPNDWELGWVARKFGLHPLAIEDATAESQRSKIEEYSTFFFLVFFTLRQRTEDVETHELDIFLGENFLITVHQEHLPELDEMERRYFRNLKKMNWGVGLLLHSLLDSIVDSYQPSIEQMDDQVEDLEDALLTNRTKERNVTITLLENKKRVTTLRRLLVAELDVLKTLVHRNTYFFDRQVTVYFRDIADHLERMVGTLDHTVDALRTTMDANFALASHQLNQAVRALTVASIILMMNALVAGIYGMNFTYMPELSWEYGYAFALLLMIFLSIILVLVFKRLRWF